MITAQTGLIHLYFVQAIFKAKPDGFCFGDELSMGEDDFILECWDFSKDIYSSFVYLQSLPEMYLLDSDIFDVCESLGNTFWELCNKENEFPKQLPKRKEFHQLIFPLIHKVADKHKRR